MKKFIVTTSIYPPSEAVEKFDEMKGWTLIVVADTKTPKYKLKNGHFMTIQEQDKLDQKLSNAIGWNSIQRRNMGFLLAHKWGADIVASTDDDNIPMPRWGEHVMIGQETETIHHETRSAAFDPIYGAGETHLWHRGFPINLVGVRSTKVTKKTIIPDIQADFWNGDPDVDAVCRMEHNPYCYFDDVHFPMSSNRIGPFNSQNTLISSNVLPYYFLFPHAGRMDDIWPSFYVQAKGFKVIWGKATVTQERNPQSSLVNMEKEFQGYLKNEEILNRLYDDPEAIWEYVPGRTVRAYQLYRRHFE